MEYYGDDWPKMPDGSDFDGKHLLSLVHSGRSPFQGVWDVHLLIREIEEILKAQVVDIPAIYKGSNYYGFHVKLLNRPDILARLSRSDVNMPNYDAFPVNRLVLEVKFEAAVYELLRLVPDVLSSRLLYHRTPVQHVAPRLDLPKDIAGRRLFLFEKPEGENNRWYDLSPEGKICLITQAARIRASLFNYNLPLDFASGWFLKCLFEQKPESLPFPVVPTRDFCVALFTSKIEATIGNIGDMIGWECDNVTVGPIALKAKQSLLRLIPHIIPTDSDEASLYRLVLEHGDFGIHNMSITMDANGQPLVTSLYDWETGCIAPAILSNPSMDVSITLVTDENGSPAITRVSDDETPDEHTEHMTWAKQYFKDLFHQAPSYERAIHAGKDARHLWFALRDWRGETPEVYFGDLGTWAEKRMKQLGVEDVSGVTPKKM